MWLEKNCEIFHVFVVDNPEGCCKWCPVYEIVLSRIFYFLLNRVLTFTNTILIQFKVFSFTI
jgi:hypothetical protein